MNLTIYMESLSGGAKIKEGTHSEGTQIICIFTEQRSIGGTCEILSS